MSKYSSVSPFLKRDTVLWKKAQRESRCSCYPNGSPLSLRVFKFFKFEKVSVRGQRLRDDIFSPINLLIFA